MRMLIVKMPMSSLFEFVSNFLFTNTECVSASKPIPLKCKGELETRLRTTFGNLFRFDEQEATHKNKFISVGHVLTVFPNQNK
jgi:hypothetical protein